MSDVTNHERYLDYRAWVKDRIRGTRGSSRRLTLEGLSKSIGGCTKGHLSLILSGKRNLNEERVNALGKAIGLRGDELPYFERLVRFNQAKDKAAKEYFLQQLIATKKAKRSDDARLNDVRVLEAWHGLVILELLRIAPIPPRPREIVHRLRNLISVNEARDALTALRDAGTVEETPDGMLHAKGFVFRSTDEISSLSVRNYHRSCLRLGDTVLDLVPLEGREFGSVNLSLSASGLARVKDRLKQLREELLEIAAEEGGPRSVCQLNFQFFALSNPLERRTQ